MNSLDSDLIGIWLLPGQHTTYEVAPDGTFHVADPEAPISFEGNGDVMIWNGLRYTRQDGTGGSVSGRWLEVASGDIWAFREDGVYEVTAQIAVDTGIWALRDGGAALWTRELRARLEANGAQVTFHPVTGGDFTYGYTVAEGAWTLLDPETWSEVARYVRPTRLADSA